MTNCWIHDLSTKEDIEEKKTKKNSKKTEPWADRTNDFQQNLDLILTPNKDQKYVQQLEKNLTQISENNQILTEKKIKLELLESAIEQLEEKTQSLINKELHFEEFQEELKNLKILY